MKIVVPYLNFDEFSSTLINDYSLKERDQWNVKNLLLPEYLGSGALHLFRNGGMQFIKAQWETNFTSYFSSPDPVGQNNMVDFRIGATGNINSAYLEGNREYKWEITKVDGMRFFCPKSFLNEDKLTLLKKFEKYCYHPHISSLVAEIIDLKPSNFHDSIKLEWKFLEFAYYYLEFLNKKDIARHFSDIPLQHIKAVRDVQHIIDTQYEQSHSIIDLSKKVGLNCQYLKQVFKRLNDCTIKQYTIKVRMEKAKEMILFGDLPINEICYKVGYSNQSHFIQLYKKTYQKTPFQHRLNHPHKMSIN